MVAVLALATEDHDGHGGHDSCIDGLTADDDAGGEGGGDVGEDNQSAAEREGCAVLMVLARTTDYRCLLQRPGTKLKQVHDEIGSSDKVSGGMEVGVICRCIAVLPHLYSLPIVLDLPSCGSEAEVIAGRLYT